MGLAKYRKWVVLFLILILWQFTVSFNIVNPLLLPGIPDIISSLFYGFTKGSLILQLLNSLSLIFCGLIVGIILSLTMCYIGYFSSFFNENFDMLSAVLHPLPGIALLPIVLTWVGLGSKAIIIIILHGVLWPLYININLGFKSIDKSLIEAARNNGATNLQLFIHVLLPCSFYSFITGVQIAWSRAWRGLISAEMIFGAAGNIGGVGWFIYESRSFMDTSSMFAGLLLVILVGILIENTLFKKMLFKG